MPAYRFSWDAFDDRTVTSLANTLGYSGAESAARPWLEARCKRPDDDFVRDTKDILCRVWLPQYPGAQNIADRLMDAFVGPMGRTPRSGAEAARYVDRCKNTARVRRLLIEALHRFGDQDRRRDDAELPGDFVPRFAVLDPKKQVLDSRVPHGYQQEAWQELTQHLAASEATGAFRGLLVMPTGSGKTFTTVRWLIANALNRGGRVLWIAHREELLNQATREFHALAGLANSRERLRVRAVSTAHCSATQIDPADDVIVASIASLTRRTDVIEAFATKDLFVVVDEAHHAAAASYRRLFEVLEGTGVRRFLGLTATPTRTVQEERGLLSKMFGERILYQVKFQTLVERGLLARPIPVVVKTDADVEADTTAADIEHLARFASLSEEWLDRIAGMVKRNELILAHYQENKAKYGKTLVFAVNVRHAALLTERLKQAGIQAEYVASWSPDGDAKKTSDVIQRFRDPQGGIDVLVNVQMFTEGVDVPAVQTVFLTRPTNSEILLRQMVGRALRGPAAGGKDKAYLVSFEDHWERFREWQGQFDLIPDIVSPTPEQPREQREKPELVDVLPWDVIKTTAQEIRARGTHVHADAFEAVPYGWYVLERIEEGEPVRQIIPVYEHQRPSWDALIQSLDGRGGDELSELSPEHHYDKYFFDCDPPRPAQHELERVLEHYRAGGPCPELHTVPDRSKCDPVLLAKHIFEADLGERKKQDLLEQRYSPLAQAIYPTMRDFRSAVEDALCEMHDPSAGQITHGVPLFEPRPEQQLSPGPKHDLTLLMADVLREGKSILGHDLVHSGPVSWSRNIIKGWLGKAFMRQEEPSGCGEIRINCLLNSPDIDGGTIKFLLWHEYLHLYLKGGHTPRFRELEKMWPNHVHADRVLDTLNERFGVQFW